LRTWARRPDVYFDSYYVLEQLYDLACKHDVRQVVIAGDVFDSHLPSAEDVMRLQDFQEKLRLRRVCVEAVTGQHDRDSRYLGTDPDYVRNVPWLSVAGVGTADRGFIRMGDYRCLALSYRNAEELPGVLSLLDAEIHDTLLCHQPWRELLPSTARYVGELSVDVPDFIRTVFTGDNHRYLDKTIIRRSGEPLRVISSGATYLCKSGEPSTHYVQLIDGREVQPVKLRSREVRYAALQTVEDADALLHRLSQYVPDPELPAPLHKPLVFVAVPDDVPAVESRLRQSTAAHFVFEPLLKAIKSDEPVVAEETSTTVDEVVRDVLRRRTADDAPAAECAERLLSTTALPRVLKELHIELRGAAEDVAL